jgi:hypothetical protein
LEATVEDTQQIEKQTEKHTKTDIAKYGPTLPMGVAGPTGVPAREIVVRPWRLKEEKELGKLRAQNQDATLTQYVTMVLATMCSKLGAVDFDTVKDFAARRLVISQMFVPDVFYAYIWLRIHAIGHELDLKLKCPYCRHEDKITADLRTTEVWVPKDPKAAEWECTLKHPLQLRGKTVTGFRMGPQRWSALETADIASGDTGAMKALTILGSVRGFLGDPMDIPLAPHELDELTKQDVERLVAALDDNMVGPVMSVEAKCVKERCGKTWNAPIDWGYDRFFSTSST